MKSVSAIVVVLLLVVAVFTIGIETAGPGEVGIRVQLAGDNRGVDEIPIQTGRIFYFRPTQRVIVYPTYEQAERFDTVEFTASRGERIGAVVNVAYQLEASKIPALYVQYRQPIEIVTNVHVQRVVKQELQNVASQMKIEEIYGEKREELQAVTTQRVRDRLSPLGFDVKYVAFDGKLDLPSGVEAAIVLASEAEQAANREENRIREIAARAQQAIEKARGEAESAREKARGEADAIEIVAKAEAEANRILVESLGGAENLIALKTVERLSDQIDVMLLPNNIVPLMGLDNFNKKK